MIVWLLQLFCLIEYLYCLWGVVFIISSLVILYSDDYMFGDLNIVHFISLVLIFVVSMLFLIISPNIISILLGWDGLGLGGGTSASACIRIPHHPSRTTP